MRPIVLGTRGSPLAMCQTQIVRARLEEYHPRQVVTLQTITVRADRHPELPLTSMGGEGVFVKELEAALVEGRIDAAVHSLKDLPLDLPAPVSIAAVLKREEARDALVSRSGQTLESLPPGARVGTSSLRRRSQLLHRRGDLQVSDIRGNVDTRVRKLDEGHYDAIIVAACGLIRLGLKERITEYLGLEEMLPEPGQGALAVEARADDAATHELLGCLEDPVSRACVEAERAFLRRLGGGCRVPIAAFGSPQEDALSLEGAVIAPDGHAQLRGRVEGSRQRPVELGERLANELIAQGAHTLLADTTSLRP